MAKQVRSYRVSDEVDALIKAEAERLTEEYGKRVSEADVIELAIVKWCSPDDVNTPVNTAVDGQVYSLRRSVAESAMREAEEKPPSPKPTPRKGAESVAERRARETKEHAAKLAEADITARMTGRDDIEYDLENVPHQSALHVALQKPATVKHSYEVEKRKVKPLTRPHGGTEAKRRREQS
jgi:hypothetical protein